MLACLFVSACLLASAAALNATSTTATTAAPSSSRSLPFTSATCIECRRPLASATAAAVERHVGAPPAAPRGPKKLVANQDAAGLDPHHRDPAEDGDDPVHDKQALHEGYARMAEDLRKEEEEEDDDDEEEGEDADLPAEQGRAEEGRAKTRQTKLGKKVDGSVLHMMMMLKMMPLMFVSTKVAVLGFLVQLKSLVLSLVSVGIAAVQFFWRFQEKRQRASAVSTLQTTAATHGWQEQGVWPDRRKYVSF